MGTLTLSLVWRDVRKARLHNQLRRSRKGWAGSSWWVGNVGFGISLGQVLILTDGLSSPHYAVGSRMPIRLSNLARECAAQATNRWPVLR